MAFNAPLNAKYEHLIFEYDVYFDPEFDWVKGGKLPGLCSYEDSLQAALKIVLSKDLALGICGERMAHFMYTFTIRKK